MNKIILTTIIIVGLIIGLGIASIVFTPEGKDSFNQGFENARER